MQQAAVQPVDSVSPAPGSWQMKVIRSLDEKLNVYQPDFALEESEPPAAQGPVPTMTDREGVSRKCKSGRTGIQSAKQDFTADRSFAAWLKTEDSKFKTAKFVKHPVAKTSRAIDKILQDDAPAARSQPIPSTACSSETPAASPHALGYSAALPSEPSFGDWMAQAKIAEGRASHRCIPEPASEDD